MEKYWFKRKRYGWGWTPATWQGWLSVSVFVSVLLLASLSLLPEQNPQPAKFVLVAVAATFCFLMLCVRTGESLRFQWGDKNKDDGG